MQEVSALALRSNALPTFLREYASLETLSATQVAVVQGSDHEIPYKDPEAIVHAIHGVWTEARHQR
jgi:hypothetical protein